MDDKLMKPTGSNTALDFPHPQTTYGYIPAAPHEPSLVDYWHLLLKRKWTVATTALVVLLLATINTLRTTPQYEAVTKIAIYRDNPEHFGFHEVTAGPESNEDWDYTVSLTTQVKVLESDTLAAQVIHALQLDKNPKFTGRPAEATPTNSSAVPVEEKADPTRDAVLVSRFHGGLTITPVPNTRLVEIRYTSNDPKLSADIANAMASNYVQYNLRTKYESTMQASDWISKQLVDLQIKVESSQGKLAEYQKEHGILGLDEKQNIITSKLNELNTELTGAEAERMRKQADYQMAAGGQAEQTPAVAANPLVASLRGQKAEIENQLAQVSSQFGPNYPKVIELNNRLKQTDAAIAAEVTRTTGRLQNEYQGAVTRERMLRGALESQKTEANKLNESAVQYNILKREAETNRQLYDGLLQKLKEAGVTAGLKSSNVRIVDPATVPLAPSKPNVPRNLALGLVLGLLGGVALAFGMELMDSTVRTPEQVQTIAALPSLGIVPLGGQPGVPLPRSMSGRMLTGKVHSRTQVGLVTYTRPKSEIAESYRALRTSILLSSLGAPPKVVLITSALPQEGKTTTTVNSAIVLAQKGARVLLVDADMRRPGVHTIMGISGRTGLSRLLTGSDTENNVIQPSRQLNNLFILPAGPPPPQPAELLGSQVMRDYLNKWRQEYDHILIDTPPALSVTDGVLLSVQADAVILVVRSGQTPKDALRRARDLMLQVNARLMGVVVNAVNLESPEMSYYYYGAKYGGKYYDNGPASS